MSQVYSHCLPYVSGHLINFQKSAIIFSKAIPHHRKEILASRFNMTLRRYLGAFFSSYYPKKAYFQHILHKSLTGIQHWETCFLSKADRHTLIKTNLEALSAYTCSLLLVPKDMCQSLDTIHRKLFWSQNKDVNGTSLISWD